VKPDFDLTVVEQKSDTPDTSSETKKMSGFSDIHSVAAAAPETVRSGDVATPTRGGPAASRGRKTKAATVEEKKQEEHSKLVEEALSKVGAEMMRSLAELPYEAWAMFFSDPEMRLTKEESKTLADSYFLIAKALKPEALADWKVLVLFALLQNGKIVASKLRERNVRQERAKLNAGDDSTLPTITM
jgi:hypothetical protein